MSSNIELLVKHVAKHITLNEEEISLFVSLVEEKKLKKREYLLKPGQVYPYENFIAKGCLRTYYADKDHYEHVVYLAMEDYWSGDLCSFWTGNPSMYYIEAIEDTVLLRIEKKNFELLLEKIPAFEKYFRILMTNSLVAQQYRILQNLSFTAEQRYLAFCERYPRLELRVPQKHIASYLGITPEFLSALRKKIRPS